MTKSAHLCSNMTSSWPLAIGECTKVQGFGLWHLGRCYQWSDCTCNCVNKPAALVKTEVVWLEDCLECCSSIILDDNTSGCVYPSTQMSSMDVDVVLL